jgi:hypothetical protein
MTSTAVSNVIVVVLVATVAFSTGWVLHDARARGLPWRKAVTWALLQWIEFPLFLWLYRRIRPSRRRPSRSRPSARRPDHAP